MDSTQEQGMNLNVETIKNASLTVKLTTVCSILVGCYWGTMQLKAQSIEWHDTHYAKRDEIITLAQADKIRGDLDATKTLAEANSAKLDNLGEQQRQLSQDFSTYAASSLVSQARSDLRAHLATQDTTANLQKWLADKENLESRVRKTEEFRSCVIENGVNCNRFLLTPN